MEFEDHIDLSQIKVMYINCMYYNKSKLAQVAKCHHSIGLMFEHNKLRHEKIAEVPRKSPIYW